MDSLINSLSQLKKNTECQLSGKKCIEKEIRPEDEVDEEQKKDIGEERG